MAFTDQMDMDSGSLALLLAAVGPWAALCGAFLRVDSGGRGRRLCHFLLNVMVTVSLNSSMVEVVACPGVALAAHFAGLVGER